MRLTPRQRELYNQVASAPNRILVVRHLNWKQANVARRLAVKMRGVFRYHLGGGAVFYLGCGLGSEVCQRLIRDARRKPPQTGANGSAIPRLTLGAVLASKANRQPR
jgi:hypothetical protein